MQNGLFNNHKNFFANFYDPLGVIPVNKREPKRPDQPQAQAPQTPNIESIKADELKKQQQKLAGRTQTIFTSPLGIDTSLNTENKTILGA